MTTQSLITEGRSVNAYQGLDRKGNLDLLRCLAIILSNCFDALAEYPGQMVREAHSESEKVDGQDLRV